MNVSIYIGFKLGDEEVDEYCSDTWIDNGLKQDLMIKLNKIFL